MPRTMQLNFFDHARDVMLRNDIAAAFEQRNAAAAQVAVRALREEFPGDELLSVAEQLLPELIARPAVPPLEAAAVAEEVQRAEQAVAPAAARVLGAAAPVWMRHWWAALAEASQAVAFDPDSADSHAAASWLNAGQWQRAADAISAIESWRRKPRPLAWMAQARWHLTGRDSTLPLLAELGWLAPAQLEPLLRALPDLALHRYIEQFDAAIWPGEDLANQPGERWGLFAAWLLVEEPRLLPVLERTERRLAHTAEQAFECVASALRLERQGAHSELMATRARLRALDERLFARYMRTR